MREAMAAAEVGDDVYGEDPTINALEAKAAEVLGKEAALFVTSGTQSNFVALLTHCTRGDEYIVGQTAHTYRYEGGGGAVLGGIQPQPLPFQADGTLDLRDIEEAIKPIDPHFARTRLLCIENTQTGRTLARHGLKIIDTLFESTACLIGNVSGIMSSGKRERIKSIIETLRGAVEDVS